MRPPPALFHLGVLGLATATATTRPAGNNNDGGGDVKISDWAWDAIKPTRHLEYHDCYGAFKCARLQLPLDWKNTSDPRTVAIAVVKLPARVPDDDATFGGSIFTNPGGPGGSGVGLVLSSGRLLQDYVDRPGRRHYEIVSFDPRGMALSRPLANCFPGTLLARDALAVESRGLGGAFRDGAAMAYVLALKQGYGQRCELAEDTAINGGDIFRYMGTPSVARDMVEMVDRIDELRRRDGQSPSAAAAEDGGDDEGKEEQGQRMELKKRAAEADDIPRLQYIGFSYGTVLGNYFASLFPERIGRIVLDGVCNTDDYSKGGVSSRS
ncbi:hypothetical protein AAL_06560 [Moelleriella libera RCEF 2490]|uniref:Uncharacterized protein n=1 Tax=Moelleriella libera RCEF 2490 TaxID=1081109 RepID=A0A167YVC9_9HYPO|nr:hypothetical protein AAL_06560 [Moelleriella libera RCEF 2490]